MAIPNSYSMHNMSVLTVDWYNDSTDTTELQQTESTTEVISYSQQKYGNYAFFIKHSDFQLFKAQYCFDLEQLKTLVCKEITFSERSVKISIDKFKSALFSDTSPKNDMDWTEEKFRVMAFGELRVNLHCVLWHLNNDKNITSEVRVKILGGLMRQLNQQVEKEMTSVMELLGVNKKDGLEQINHAKSQLAYHATKRLVEEEQKSRIRYQISLGEFEQDNLVNVQQILLNQVAYQHSIPVYKIDDQNYIDTRINPKFISTYHEKIKQEITDLKACDLLVKKYHFNLLKILKKYDAVSEYQEIKLPRLETEKCKELAYELNTSIRPYLIPFVGHDRFDVLDLVLVPLNEKPISTLQLKVNIEKVLAVGLIDLLYGIHGSDKGIVRFKVDKNRYNLNCDIEIVVASDFFSWLEIKTSPKDTQAQLQLPTFKDLIWIRYLQCPYSAKQHLLMQILADKLCVNEEQLQEITSKIFEFILTFECVNEFNDLCCKSVKLGLNCRIFPLKDPATRAILTPLISKLLINFIKKQCTPAGMEIMNALIKCEIENEENRYSKIKCSYEPFLDALIQKKLLLNLPLSDVDLGRIQTLIRCNRNTLTTEGDWLTAVDWKKVTSPNREQILGITVLEDDVVLLSTLLSEFSPNVSARFFRICYGEVNYTPYKSLLKLAFDHSNECFKLLIKQPDIDVNAYCNGFQQTLLHTYGLIEFLHLLLALPHIDVFVVDSANKTALLRIVEDRSVEVLTGWFESQHARLEVEESAATSEPSLMTEGTENVYIDEVSQVVTYSKRPRNTASAKYSDWVIIDSLSVSLKNLLKVLTEHSAFENIYPALCEHFSNFKEEAESNSNAEILLVLWFNKNKEQVAAAYLYLHSLEQNNLNVSVVFNRIEGSQESQALVLKAKLKLGQRLDFDEQEYCFREFNFLVNKQYIPKDGGYFEYSNYVFILFCAIKREQLEFVASLLTEHKTLRYLNIYHQHFKFIKPIHFACTPLKFCLSIGCSDQMLKLFIELREDDLFDKEDSILRVAIAESRDDLLHLLLDYVKKQAPERLIEFIEQRECACCRRTPLGIALEIENQQAAKHLVDFGADIFQGNIIILEGVLGSEYASEQLQKQALEQQKKNLPSHFNTIDLYEQFRWLNVMRLRNPSLPEVKLLVDKIFKNCGKAGFALNQLAKQGCGLILRTHQRFDSNFSKQIKNEMELCASNNKSEFEVIIKLLNKETVLD